MACCGLDKDKPIWVVLPVVLLVLLAALVGCLAALLLYPFSRRARRSVSLIGLFIAATFRELRDRLWGRAYLISPRLRCAVSGRLMRFSPRFAGFVHKRLGSIVLAMVLVAGVACWLALRASGGAAR